MGSCLMEIDAHSRRKIDLELFTTKITKHHLYGHLAFMSTCLTTHLPINSSIYRPPTGAIFNQEHPIAYVTFLFSYLLDQ